jgi:secondary thiamine-phosphate synthase enzyme
MLKTIAVKTPPGENLINITPSVRDLVRASGVVEGLCVLYSPHTTASLTINSQMDPRTQADILADLKRLVPTRVDFQHIYDTPADAAGHIKTTLVGISQSLIVTGGELLLGSSQGIFFYEFDGPRDRQVIVRILADHD